jgi:hypothetical protein
MKIKLNYKSIYKELNLLLLIVEIILGLLFLSKIDNNIVKKIIYLLMIFSIVNFFILIKYKFNYYILKKDIMSTRFPIAIPFKIKIPYEKIENIIITNYQIFFLNKKEKEILILKKSRFKENEIVKLIDFFKTNTEIPIIKKDNSSKLEI